MQGAIRFAYGLGLQKRFMTRAVQVRIGVLGRLRGFENGVEKGLELVLLLVLFGAPKL